MKPFLIALALLIPSGFAFGQTRSSTQSASATPSVVPWDTEKALAISGKGPVYPQIARVAHVEGCVYIRMVVSADGSVREAAPLGGPPLMMESALNAVATWKFKTAPQEASTVARVCYFLPSTDVQKQIGVYQRAIEKTPNDSKKLIALARDLLLFGMPEEAEAYFRRALTVKSDDDEAALGLGDSLAAQGRFGVAVTAYQIVSKMDDVDKAVKLYRRALNESGPKLFREDPFLHYCLGQLLETKGEKARAEKEYGIAAKEMPWDQQFRSAYSRLSEK